MIGSNILNVNPKVKGGIVSLDFQTRNNLGTILFKNGVFYKEVDKVRTLLGRDVAGSDGQLQYNNGGILGATSQLYWDDSSDSLGIGTDSPSALLHINGIPGTLDQGLVFGDGDTGFHEIADDSLYVTVGGESKWQFVGNALRGTTTGSPEMTKLAATATQPSYAFRGDTDTGLGRAAANQLSIIANSIESIRVIDTGVFIYNLKSGANQGAAGAAVNELWIDTADNSIKIGV